MLRRRDSPPGQFAFGGGILGGDFPADAHKVAAAGRDGLADQAQQHVLDLRVPPQAVGLGFLLAADERSI